MASDKKRSTKRRRVATLMRKYTQWHARTTAARSKRTSSTTRDGSKGSATHDAFSTPTFAMSQTQHDTLPMTRPDDEGGRKSFLDLIPVIRNIVYQIMIDDNCPSKLLPHGEGFKLIAIDSPMLLVNKQISKDFSSLAVAKVPTFEARVKRLEFGCVETFLILYSDRHLRRIPFSRSIVGRAILNRPKEFKCNIRIVLSWSEISQSLACYNIAWFLSTKQMVGQRQIGLEFEWAADHLPPRDFVDPSLNIFDKSFRTELFDDPADCQEALQDWNKVLVAAAFASARSA